MILDYWSTLCSRHREETLPYLTVKTAAVRCGLKPAELLRVPYCRVMPEGCSKMRSVVTRLGLPYRVLSENDTGALVLFWHPAALVKTLDEPETAAYLRGLGYPVGAGCAAMLAELARRWQDTPAHEVGIFIGYPLKDVRGFCTLEPEPRQPGDRWRIFGGEGDSRRRMALYRHLELSAAAICAAESTDFERFRRIAALSQAVGHLSDTGTTQKGA